MSWMTRLGQLRSVVATYSALPLSSNVLGDVRIATDTGDAYTWTLVATSGLLTDWKKITTSNFSELVGSPSASVLAIDDAVLAFKGLIINMAIMAFIQISNFGWLSMKMFDGFVEKFGQFGGDNSFQTGVDIDECENEVFLNSTQTIPHFEQERTDHLYWYAPYRGDLDANTVFLAHGDGVNGSTSFIDLLRNPIVAHNVTTNTSVKKFGTGSLAFNGTSSYLEVDETDNIIFGNGNLTIDFWVNLTANTAFTIYERYVDTNNRIEIYYNGDGKIVVEIKDQGNDVASYITTASLGLSTATWYHIAIVRVTTNLLVFVNGVSQTVTETVSFSTNAVPALVANLNIGGGRKGYLNGYIDEIRISDSARYITAFTPMTRAYNEEVLSLPSYVPADSSAGAKTITAHGNARLSGNNLSFGNASLYLDGVDSYLSLADSDDWKLSDGLTDYTVDLWIDPLALTDLNTYVIGQDDAWKLTFDGTSNKYLKFSTGNGIDTYTKLMLHLNNSIVDETGKTLTNNGVTFSTTNKFGGYSGNFNGSSYLQFNDSSDMLLDGDWTIDFWVKTTSSTPMAILSQEDSGSDILELAIGAGQIRLVLQSPSPSWSTGLYSTTTVNDGNWHHVAIVRQSLSQPVIYIDGVAETSYSYNGGNWTIRSMYNSSEVWTLGQNKYAGGTRRFNGLLDELRISKGIRRWTSNFTVPSLEYVPVVDLIAPIAISTGAWSHVAVVQSSGIVKLYVNGVLGGSVTASNIINGVAPLTIGASSSGANLFYGYIEEVRISKGIARWTSNFTIPSQEYSSDSYTKLLAHLNVIPVENMKLQSVNFTASNVPSSARVVVFEEDIQEIEPNVDLTVRVSRDGGVTFTPIILAKDMEYDDGRLNIYTGSVGLGSQPSGNLMQYELKTQNNKDCRIRGIAINWR